jgi:hypothetical protein
VREECRELAWCEGVGVWGGVLDRVQKCCLEEMGILARRSESEASLFNMKL